MRLVTSPSRSSSRARCADSASVFSISPTCSVVALRRDHQAMDATAAPPAAAQSQWIRSSQRSRIAVTIAQNSSVRPGSNCEPVRARISATAQSTEILAR